MSNQRQYRLEKWYKALWMVPHIRRAAGMRGSDGVALAMVECIDRGHVKSGCKIRGIHGLSISGRRV